MKRQSHDDASMPQVKLFFRFSLHVTVISALQKKSKIKLLHCTRIRGASNYFLDKRIVGLGPGLGQRVAKRGPNASEQPSHERRIMHNAIPLPRVGDSANMALAALSPERGVRSRKLAHRRVLSWDRSRRISQTGHFLTRAAEGAGPPATSRSHCDRRLRERPTAVVGRCQPSAAVRGLGRSLRGWH